MLTVRALCTKREISSPWSHTCTRNRDEPSTAMNVGLDIDPIFTDFDGVDNSFLVRHNPRTRNLPSYPTRRNPIKRTSKFASMIYYNP